jgi:hypothetical protein
MGYILGFDEITKKLIVNFKVDEKNNNYAVNIILNSVSETKGLLFNDITSAYEMWYALINVYEDNN